MEHVHPPAASADCCAHGAKATPPAPHAHHAHHAHPAQGAPASLPRLTTSATVHCLTGCAIGELAGLLIGVSLGLNPWATMALATVLGFASGYALGLRPLVKQGMGVGQAFRAIWLGETISIAVMEFAMNFTDYHVGGVAVASVLAPRFWLGYALALPAGFLVAWPVNYWLLKRNVKEACH